MILSAVRVGVVITRDPGSDLLECIFARGIKAQNLVLPGILKGREFYFFKKKKTTTTKKRFAAGNLLLANNQRQ